MIKNKGISLIVLVITIIVMVILAGAVIVSLSNAGIINKASEAIDKTNVKQVQTLAELKWAEAYLEENIQKDSEYRDYVINNLVSEGVDISAYDIQVTTNGVTVTLKNDTEVVSVEITGNDGQFKYVKLKNGSIQITRYIGEATSVEIPANYDGFNVYAVGNIDANMHSSGKIYNIFGATNSISNTSITSITLSEGIKEIKAASFNSCTALKSVTLPSTLETIGTAAFRQCSNLNAVNGALIIPEGVTTIGDYAFAGCSGLTGNIIIPEGVETVSNGAFYNCTGFKGTLSLPSTLRTIGDYAFAGCSGLTGNIAIPEGVETVNNRAFYNCTGFKGTLSLPSTLRTIGDYAFSGCSGLTGNIIIPEGVETISYAAFSNCTGFKGMLNFPSTLRTIGGFAFNKCTGLTGNLTIPEGTTTIGSAAFQYCSSLNGKLTLPSTIEVIEDYAFNHCSKLTNETVTIPKTVKIIGQYVTHGTHIFYDFANETFKEIIVDEDNQYFKDVDGVLFNKQGTRLIAYPPAKEGNHYEIPEGVTVIDELGFGRAGYRLYDKVDPGKRLKSVTLPNSYVLTDPISEGTTADAGTNLTSAIHIYTGVEAVNVKADNPNYKSEDGVLYSKDGTELWYVPVQKTGEIRILDTVTTIKVGALNIYSSETQLRDQTVIIPASVTEIDDYSISCIEWLGSSKIIFEEGCVYKFNEDGTVGKTNE